MELKPVESDAQFNSRIELEEVEASYVACPLDTCRAAVNEPCVTDSGEPRIRHCRRLMLARKAAQK